MTSYKSFVTIALSCTTWWETVTLKVSFQLLFRQKTLLQKYKLFERECVFGSSAFVMIQIVSQFRCTTGHYNGSLLVWKQWNARAYCQCYSYKVGSKGYYNDNKAIYFLFSVAFSMIYKSWTITQKCKMLKSDDK